MTFSTETCDVVLVGGGVIGLSLAWELAQQGIRVCLLERGELGREASWAAAGMLPPGPPQHLWQRVSTYDRLAGESHELHPQWHQQLLEATGIDNGYRRSGAIYLEQTPFPSMASGYSASANRLSEWRTLGITHLPVDAVALADLEPLLVQPNAGWYLPDEAQLRPPRHLQALVAACLRAGVALRSGCEVQDWETQGSRVSAAISAHGRFVADQFCLTAGAWTGGLATRLGTPLPIRPVRGQMVLLEGPPGTLKHIVSVGPRYLTPRADGRVLVGSTMEEDGFDKRNTVAGLAELLSFARDLCPTLESFAVEQFWSGLRPGTPDENPYLGRLSGYENAWIAAGHFRAGMQLSPATAVMLRKLILGGGVLSAPAC